MFEDLTGDQPNDPARSTAIALRGAALMHARPDCRLLIDAVNAYDALPHLAVLADGQFWVWHFVYHRDVNEGREQLQAVLASIELDRKWAALGLRPCAGPSFKSFELPIKMRGSNISYPPQLIEVDDSAIPGVQQYKCTAQRSTREVAERYLAVSSEAVWTMSDARIAGGATM